MKFPSPTYAPEGDVAAPVGDVGGGAPPPAPPAEQQHDGPGSGRSAIRQSLEKGFKEDNARRDKADREQTKFLRERQRQENRGGPNHQPAEEDEVDDAELLAQQEQQQQTPEAPQGFPKEAKAEWAKTPEVVRAAILKRVEDMDKGVSQLKQSYADLDTAFKPYDQVLQAHGKSRAEGTKQLFDWFLALARSPDQAFPALMQSFRYDPRRLLAALQGQQQPPTQQQQPQGQQGQPKIDPAIMELFQQFAGQVDQKLNGVMGNFDQRFGAVNTNLEHQMLSKSQEILDQWSRGKPYFEDVRQEMARMINTGLYKYENVSDLDRIYDAAVHMNPDVRNKYLGDVAAKRRAEREEKRKAELAAQQAEADRARRAGNSSLAGGAPGELGIGGGRKVAGKKSVRESLNDALEEARRA